MKPDIYPLCFTPVYKDYIWGGTRIPEVFDREPQPGRCAESWEICDRSEGMSIVSNGTREGTSLHDLVKDMGTQLVGREAPTDRFPLLIKIIDAADKLSVQVHPDDETARRVGGEAKTEMWYMLNGAPGAQIYAGLTPGTDAESFRQALSDGTVAERLVTHDATPGSLAYIRGGCVHAIGAGCLLLEVQQNSNTTYRVYDWGRVGDDGKPRELHVEKAIQTIGWDLEVLPAHPGPVVESEGLREQDLIVSPYFRIRQLELHGETERANDGESFHALFVVEGTVTVTGNDHSETLGPGSTCLLPAALEAYQLNAPDPCRLLRISLT